ncbi:3H domain protein [Alkaliphilus metalliredigens QYMF]|uniref:3H domain protein n=1 Tax=Alkaliphilus metalliredigens (strain QYMF) TaxID=293826 RepID=A6TJ95_ALKMQ|nr:transcription repressor NadR [Alkaliphilus metalliredigens]ABR46263.1 3H domain protein [Alkaliphilus metalliredigens QYMF]
MNTQERRAVIAKRLEERKGPIKGTELAKWLQVSRQVIVQDIALLRAEGTAVIATPQGYVILKSDKKGLTKTVVSKHENYEEMEEELQIMIDHGARVVDVIVEHPLYGEIRGMLDISYGQELKMFMKKIRTEKAEPLSSLTYGIHIHTLEVPSEESFNKMNQALMEKGYLINE